jgi:hypothetical protein
MSDDASPTELTSHYTAQVTADLERNTKEQERIGGEIAALQEQLAGLERDHAVLVKIQQAIDTAPASTGPAAHPDRLPVPVPRKKGTAGSSAGKRAPGKKPAPESGRGTAGKPAAEKRAGKADTTKTAQPTLVDLVRRHLDQQREPRSAAEITTALGQAYPDRGVKKTVVRTTLEGLVARNQAQRTKQGTSVFYTRSDVPEPATPAEEQPAPADA